MIQRFLRLSFLRLIAIVLLLIWPFVVGAQSDEIPALLAQFDQLYKAHKYEDALPVARRLAELSAAKYGTKDQNHGRALHNLAIVNEELGHLDEAERLYRAALSIADAVLGGTSPDALGNVERLAEVCYALNKNEEAITLLRRLIDAHRRADDAVDIKLMVRMGELYHRIGDFKRSDETFRTVLGAYEAAYGKDDPRVAMILNNLGVVHGSWRRFDSAESYHKRALGIREAALGPQHPATLQSVENLARFYRDIDRYGDAEPFFRRLLSERQATFGAEHPEVVEAMNNLGENLAKERKYQEAEELYKTAFSLAEKISDSPKSVATILTNQAELYRTVARYADAAPLYQRALELVERKPGEEQVAAIILNDYAALETALGRFHNAEQLLRRAIALSESALGSEHEDVAIRLSNLAHVLQTVGRLDEAEKLYLRALAIQKKTFGSNLLQYAVTLGSLSAVYLKMGRLKESAEIAESILKAEDDAYSANDPRLQTTLNNLAAVRKEQGLYADALQYAQRALAIAVSTWGPDHPETATTRANLAAILDSQGKYEGAKALYLQSLAAQEVSLGPEHPDVARTLNNLAEAYHLLGRFDEAEPLLWRALGIREKTLGFDHPETASSLNNLALVLQSQRRLKEAEPLLRRAVAIDERNGRGLAISLANLATLLDELDRVEEARTFHERALREHIREAGSEGPAAALAENNFAELLRSERQYAKAEELYLRALGKIEKVFGPEHPLIAIICNNIGELYRVQQRFSEAEGFYQRALTIKTRVYGEKHVEVANTRYNLALMRLTQRDFNTAYELFTQVAKTYYLDSRYHDRVVSTADRELSFSRVRASALDAIRAAIGIIDENPERAPQLAGETFEFAQIVLHSRAAAALSRTVARIGNSDTEVGETVRLRDAAATQYQAIDKALLQDIARPPEGRDQELEARLRTDRDAAKAQFERFENKLRDRFDKFPLVADPLPLTLTEIQEVLRSDEALLQILTDPDGGVFVWLVTKEIAGMYRTGMTASQVAEHVSALRCGLDTSSWTVPAEAGWPNTSVIDRKRIEEQLGRRENCRKLLGVTVSDQELPPFDFARAHALYSALFGPGESKLKNADGSFKHVLVVSSGALASLPFQVLITDGRAKNGEHPDPAWLVKRSAITVLPSISALASLRKHARASSAHRPYIAFANPLLEGDLARAELARKRQSCGNLPEGRIAGASRSISAAAAAAIFKNGQIDVEAERQQQPLPETADEVCQVARNLGVTAKDEGSAIWLGNRAREHWVKELDRNKTLSDFAIIHFATHGLLAGESEAFLKAKAEPALMLTPPDRSSAIPLTDDDGLLMASEIAELNLDADWIILSACNTGAGEKDDTEALSGLARAFFFAGARSLLVSHWEVDSDAGVKLVTRAFRELVDTHSEIGQAEAMRRSMLAMMNDQTRPANWPSAKHPAVWAPFSLIGEKSR